MAWVSGRNRANHASPCGSALTGNSEPAKKKGTIAMAGTAAMYSSTLGTRFASVSATPYMPTASSEAPPTKNAMPVALVWKSAPRSVAATIRTTTCRVVMANATARLPKTMSGRGIGAASMSRRAPLSRSTITPIPENMVLIGMSSPAVAIATNVM